MAKVRKRSKLAMFNWQSVARCPEPNRRLWIADLFETVLRLCFSWKRGCSKNPEIWRFQRPRTCYSSGLPDLKKLNWFCGNGSFAAFHITRKSFGARMQQCEWTTDCTRALKVALFSRNCWSYCLCNLSLSLDHAWNPFLRNPKLLTLLLLGSTVA